jgi:hypothetical protein
VLVERVEAARALRAVTEYHAYHAAVESRRETARQIE